MQCDVTAGRCYGGKTVTVEGKGAARIVLNVSITGKGDRLRRACCWLRWHSCSLGYTAQSPNNGCPSSLGSTSVIALESILVTNSMAPSLNHKFLGGKDQFLPALCPPAH